eukprot:1147497-Pelagomonas_calceolata.AAC.5
MEFLLEHSGPDLDAGATPPPVPNPLHPQVEGRPATNAAPHTSKQSETSAPSPAANMLLATDLQGHAVHHASAFQEGTTGPGANAIAAPPAGQQAGLPTSPRGCPAPALTLPSPPAAPTAAPTGAATLAVGNSCPSSGARPLPGVPGALLFPPAHPGTALAHRLFVV